MKTLKLSKISRFVFDLPEEYRNILKFLSENGPSNISSIARFTKNSEEHQLDRWALKKRIYGTQRITGLFDSEYLFEKLEEKHRYKKQEKTYYLEAKGIMASLATTPLAKNYFFNKVVDSANKNTKGKKFPSFIKEYLTSQIHLFLAYYYLEGIQLTWQTNFTMSYYDFFTNKDDITLAIKNKKTLQEFSELVDNFVILHSVYEYLNVEKYSEDDSFSSIFYYSEPTPKSSINAKHWKSYVRNWYTGLWYHILDDMEKEVHQIRKKKNLIYSTDKIIWENIWPEVREKLSSLGVDTPVSLKSNTK